MMHTTIDIHTLLRRTRTPRCLAALLCAGALIAGCADDVTQRASDTPLPEGCVVVDYSVADDGETRSVSHTPLPADKRIKSLTYLLYESGGKFVKKREIPGIADMSENDWPMKRSTMSWEQREALKDTLLLNSEYKALFIANADPDLFGGEEVLHIYDPSDGEMPLPLSDIYLSLPRLTAFGDHNMFYLCTRDITPLATTDRDNHMDCPVVLQRAVCRTDFFSDDYPAWDSDFTRGKIRDFTDDVYEQLIAGMTAGNTLHTNDMLNQFTLDFAEWVALHGHMAIPGFPIWEAAIAVEINNMDCRSFINNISDSDATAIKDILYESCLENKKLRNAWMPWKGMSARVKYEGCADRLYLNGINSDGSAFYGDLSPMLDIVELKDEADNKLQHTFTVIGFGENASAEPQNIFKEVQLYTPEDTDTPATVIPVDDACKSFPLQGINRRVQLEYVPISTLEYNKNVTTGRKYKLQPVDLSSKISQENKASNVFMGFLQDFFDSDKGKQYGKGIDQFVLEIALPDLSRDDALVVTPEWRVK